MEKTNEPATDDVRFDTDFHNDLRFVWHYSKEAQRYHGRKRLSFPILLGYQENLLDMEIEFVFARRATIAFLKRNKIYTIGQLMNQWGNLMKFRSCGITRFMEIQNGFMAWYYDQLSQEQKKIFWKKVFQ